MRKHAVENLRLIKAKGHYKFVQYFSFEYMPSDASSRMVHSRGEVKELYLERHGQAAIKGPEDIS